MRDPRDLTSADEPTAQSEASEEQTRQASPGGAPVFRLARLEETPAPDGAGGQTWYRYVLENGSSTIVGHRAGTHDEVTEYAMSYASQLNTRSATGHSAWTPRSKKPS
jgi:hypothetical protein